MKQVVHLTDLGTHRSYKEIWDLQEQMLAKKVHLKGLLREQVAAGKVCDQEGTALPEIQNDLLLVEHNPVYTLGKSGDISNVLISDEDRAQKGIEFFKINRGGDITFHGPEQLVGYPIIDLEQFRPDLGWYLRSLEEVIIMTMANYGLHGDRSAGETGVWLEPGVKGRERKICAMGIRCSRWITMHGFAFNINTDLRYFDHIIPCGIQNKQVTSLQQELERKVDMEEIKAAVAANFAKVFDVEIMAQ